jgi:protein-tyrosine phosphatase
VKKAKAMGIVFLEMEWIDDISYIIELGDLVRCVEFIHSGISSGGNVLVHCAQGKSRSATAVIAYVMATRGLSSLEGQDFVKEHRKMAEPNAKFLEILKSFEASQELIELRKTMPQM